MKLPFILMLVIIKNRLITDHPLRRILAHLYVPLHPRHELWLSEGR